MFYGCGRFFEPIPQTPEQRAAHAAREAEYERRRQEAVGANERAEALLKERLGLRHYLLFKATGTLTRKSRLWPGIMYWVRRGEKVKVVERGRVTTELCVISGHGEPEADRLMSILDLIETGQEERLWEMANVFPQR